MAFSVSYVYEVIDKYSHRLEKINRVTRRFENGIKNTRGSLKKMNQRLTSFQGGLASVAGMLGAAGIGKTFVSFEQSMNRLEAVTLANSGQMYRLRMMAKKLGKETQFSASQAATAMVFLAQAGLSVDQVLSAIPGSLQLAAAGGIQLSEAADIATNVLAQMGFQVTDLSRVNDVLSLTQARANTNILELFEAMRPVAVTAKNLGIELEELVASLGVMANAGEKGSLAGTLLRNALTRLAGAGKTQRKIYRALGIDLSNFIDEAGKLKNFTQFIGKLKEVEKRGRLTVPVLQTLFGERGFRAIQILAGAGAEEIARLDAALKQAGGTAEKMALIQMKGLPGVVKAFASAWEAVQIAIFESGFADLVIKLGERFTSMLRTLTQTNPTLLKLVAVVGSLLIVLGAAVIVIGLLTGAIAALLSPVGAVIAAIGALVAIGVTLWNTNDNIRDAFMRFYESVKKVASGFSPLIDLFKSFFSVTGGADVWLDAMAAGIVAIGKALELLTWPLRTINSLIGQLFTSKLAKTVISNLFSIKQLFGIGRETTTGGARSSLTAARSHLSGMINGSIQVSATQGSRIDKASLNTDIPGNLGLNLGGP